jgi:NAD(P)-dependent dehydrogenase (short-subunit alcohol dehydrogenase family)
MNTQPTPFIALITGAARGIGKETDFRYTPDVD